MSNSGLGRGLSGILDDVAGHTPASEVSALLGSGSSRNSPEVRRIVAELAVDTMSSAFAADGVLMARLGEEGEVDSLQTRLAGAWAPNDPVGFEINGRLWNCLTERTSRQGQVPVGGLNVLLARHKVGSVVIASAVVRSRPFDVREQDQLAGLIRSAARATEVDASLPENSAVNVRLSVDPSGPEGKTSNAVVDLQIDGQSRTGRACAATADAATAKATIDLLGVQAKLRFAGSTTVEGERVTIVVVDGGAATAFGLAVTPPDASFGAVEATLSAAISGGLEPLGRSLLT